MDQQIAIRRAAAALIEAQDALRPILPVGYPQALWDVTQEVLREELLKTWVWETIREAPDPQKRVSVDDLWAAWAQLWGLEPSDKTAGGYPRRVWTQAVSVLPNRRGVRLGDRTAKRSGGKVLRFWLGVEFIPKETS